MELPALSPVSPPIPIAPTADVWRAMSPAAELAALKARLQGG